MGTPYAPPISAGYPQDYVVSGTSEQNESFFQELATLSTQQAGSFPTNCIICWFLLHGHVHSALSPQQLFRLQQQQLHIQHHQQPRLTAEQTWTPVDGQQQVLHEHQEHQVLHEHQQHQVLHEHQQHQVLHEHQQHQVLHEHQHQELHEYQQRQILHEFKEQKALNEQEQQQLLQERKGQQVLEERKQLQLLQECKEQQVFEESKQQQLLDKRKEQQALEERKQQQLLQERKEQQVLEERKQQQALEEGKEQQLLQERKDQQVLEERKQQQLLQERKEQQVFEERKQQQLLQDRNEQQALEEWKQQQQQLVLHEPKKQQQLVLHEPKKQQLLQERKQQQLLQERKEQQVLEEHKQQQLLQERKEQQVLEERKKQQQLLQERKEQQALEEHKKQQVLEERKKQQQLLQERKEQQVLEERKKQQQQLLQERKQQVLDERKQQLLLQERKEQQVLEERKKQQQLLQERKEQQALEEHKQQQLLEEHKKQQVLEERKKQQVLEERKKQQQLLQERKEQQVLEERKKQQQQLLQERKEQQVLEERKKQQQQLLQERKEQQVLEERKQQHLLQECKQQQVLHEHQQTLHEHQQALHEHQQQQSRQTTAQTGPPQADRESHGINREGQYGRSSPDMKTPVQIEVVEKNQPPSGTSTAKPSVNHGGSALENSLTATTYYGLYDHGSSGNSRPLGGGILTEASAPVTQSPTREGERPGVPKSSWFSMITGRGSSHGVDKHHDSMNTEKVQSRDTHSGKWEMEKAELMKKVTDAETSNHGLRLELEQARHTESQLRAQLQESNAAVTIRDCTVSSMTTTITQYKSKTIEYETRIVEYETRIAEYETRIVDYKAIADNLTEQLSSLELRNSKQVGGAGAHKDSHATPPNLVKSREVVSQAVVTCTKAFIAFLKERNAYESHVAVLSVPNKQDERSRKYAVQAYICSRLFAGFENDCYMDGLDCVRSSKYLPAKYEETQNFFLRNQNLQFRYKQYVAEYESLQELGVQGIMNTLKNLDTVKKLEKDANAPFFQFCCRKLVSIFNDVDKFVKVFPPSGDYSQRFLLQQLATNSVYCDKFLKPFVNVAMAAFLLHRLAFQFHPPARIFRYVSGTSFDETYMKHAGPIDDEDSDKEFAVSLMLIPGFQVGGTIIKCVVSSVPCSTATTRGPL